MTETVTAPRHGEVRQGLISKSLTAFARTLQWLALSLLFSILIEWAGMVWWWQDQGLAHSRKMLRAELSYLESDFRRSVLTSDPARFTKAVADKTYHVLFEVTRFVELIEWVSTPVVPGEHGVLWGASHPRHQHCNGATVQRKGPPAWGARRSRRASGPDAPRGGGAPNRPRPVRVSWE